MKLNSLHARSLRLHRRRASRAGMALAFAAAAACAVTAPNVFAAGDDGSASSSSSSSSSSSTGTKIRDATVTTKVKAALIGTSGLSAGDVHVKTRRGNVTLTGSVPDEQQRTMAVNAVKQVDGVQDVRDQLTIRPK